MTSVDTGEQGLRFGDARPYGECRYGGRVGVVDIDAINVGGDERCWSGESEGGEVCSASSGIKRLDLCDVCCDRDGYRLSHPNHSLYCGGRSWSNSGIRRGGMRREAITQSDRREGYEKKYRKMHCNGKEHRRKARILEKRNGGHKRVTSLSAR